MAKSAQKTLLQGLWLKTLQFQQQLDPTDPIIQKRGGERGEGVSFYTLSWAPTSPHSSKLTLSSWIFIQN